MNIETYFTDTKGIGVMATSNSEGVVDTAIYSRPHVQGSDEVTFIMNDRLTHKNLQENNHANYLFLEEGQGYSGVRLFLSKIGESSDQEQIASLSRRHVTAEQQVRQGEKYLVRFKIDKVLTLIGGNELPAE